MPMASFSFLHNITVASWRTTRVSSMWKHQKISLTLIRTCQVLSCHGDLFCFWFVPLTFSTCYHSHVRVRCPLTTKLVSFIISDYLMKMQLLVSFVKTFLVNFQKIHLTSRWKPGLRRQSRQRSCTSHKDTSAPNHHHLHPDFLAVSGCSY